MPNIMIVGEAWGEAEEQKGQPFVGPSGYVLNGMLKAAGINRDDCYLTNVFNFHPASNNLKTLCGTKTEALKDWPQLATSMWIREQFRPEIERLLREVDTIQPNVIIALGNTPLWALTKNRGIKKTRGTPIHDFTQRYKVFPTYHPSAVMRQWKLRPIVIADLAKANRESAFPEIRRPERFVHIPESIEDLWSFHETYIEPSPDVSCDIETATIDKIPTITEVGFAPDISNALVVPFLRRRPVGNFWSTRAEELEAWQFVQHVLKTKPLIGQNFLYDLQYFWWEMGLEVDKVADDTMILHHSMYPEMEKGLAFLGSIYTDEPSWKMMRQEQSSFKKEE